MIQSFEKLRYDGPRWPSYARLWVEEGVVDAQSDNVGSQCNQLTGRSKQQASLRTWRDYCVTRNENEDYADFTSCTSETELVPTYDSTHRSNSPLDMADLLGARGNVASPMPESAMLDMAEPNVLISAS